MLYNAYVTPFLFSDCLQELRRKRSLSLGQLSLQSGVSKATLSRWESGTHLPRIPELSHVLDALALSPTDRARCLRLLDTPRAVIAARHVSGAPGLLSLGDFLYGLRHRSGKTQTDIAAAASVSRSLYVHWEKDLARPSCEQLHKVAFALGASASEAVTLMGGQFAQTPLEKSREAVLAQYQKLFDIGIEYTQDAYNLQLLALLTHAGRLLREGKAGSGDVGLIVTAFGNGAMIYSNDIAVQGVYHRRALALANRCYEPLHFHIAGAVRSLLDKRVNRQPYKTRIADAMAWLPRLSDNAGKAYLLMFIAKEMAKYETDAAMRLADEYCALVADRPGEYLCRLQDRGKLLLLCGRAAEGVAFIAATASQDTLREGLKQLLLAEGLLTLGSHTEARACLDSGAALLAPMGYASVRSQVETLELALN